MVASAKPNPFKDPSNPSSQELPERLIKLLPGMRLLVVDADPAVAAAVRKAMGAVEGKLGARRPPRRQAAQQATVFAAADLAEARQVLRKLASRAESVDLVIAESRQADGEGLSLAEALAAARSEARLILTSASPTLSESLSAFRAGALDYLPKPLTPDLLRERLRLALARRYLQVKDQRRLHRLKGAVRQLNQARRTVGQKVDLLCQDLVSAYSDLSRQFERVRVGEHLRRLLDSAADLEQMLCHMMDWLLRELGHCNIAIFLADDNGKSELGAYMKHTVAGDEAVTKWLARHIVPRAGADGWTCAGGEAGELPATGSIKALREQAVLAADCTYLAESLGTIVVFRPADKPFNPDALELLKAAGPVFATALTNLVRGADENGRRKQEEAADDQDEDADEWWRRGESAA